MTTNGGYGVLYGPNVDVNGVAGTGEGKIGGDEHIAYADDGTGKQNVTLMVQIPSTFSIANACIVTAASSGSRGVYGAIATAGEWGLKHGCAVAYADKGTGNGEHDLANDMVTNIRGQAREFRIVGTASQFTANLNAADLAAFNAAFPNRAGRGSTRIRSRTRKGWGRDTLRAVEFAFYMLNEIRPALGRRRAVVISSPRTRSSSPPKRLQRRGRGARAAVEQDGRRDSSTGSRWRAAGQVNLPSSITISAAPAA
jgi:hydroxybutyrate-dimer hydrolase